LSERIFPRVDLCGLNTVEGETFRWCGKYEGNMACAKTLDVRLNVFGKFYPELPECSRKDGFVFLANCSPRTQAHVLDQLSRPKFVLCDTMNYWIENDRKALLKTLARVDAVTMNSDEVCQLTGNHMTAAAARKLLAMGPKYLIVKRGEHGASLFIRGGGCFAVPAFPLETVKDPTGAGDSFAGGFTGYLASAGAIGEKTLKRALVYGTVMASHAVQGFGIGRLGRLTRVDVESRFEALKRMMTI
jgi:sugar/nucleoside kinase (ribokinase family)